MSDLTIRPAYRTWPLYNQRLRDVLAAMTEEQLALRPSPDTVADLGDRWSHGLSASVLALRLRR